MAAILVLYSFSTAYGAAPVEESVAEDVVPPGDAVSLAGSPTTAGNPPGPAMEQATAGQQASELGQLFYQLQLLRDEVQRLNGALEEQQNQIERLAREQHERYLGLDRRIAELSGEPEGQPLAGRQQSAGFPRNRQQREGEPLAGRQPSAGEPFQGTQPPIGEGSPLRGPQPPGDDSSVTGTGPFGQGEPTTERGTYDSAYDMMQRQQYAAAAEVFQRLIDEYPNGQYTPNAYYWLGELHRKNGDPEAARQSFALVVNFYPDHHKVPDALYKLGVVYTQLNEPGRALEYLDQVIREYPDTTAASLAEQHAAELR